MNRTPVIEPLESRRLLAVTAVAPLVQDEALDYFGAGATAANLNGTVYFAARTRTSSDNAELWKSDGTTSTRLASFADSAPTSVRSPLVSNLTPVAGFVFFNVNQGSNTEIWRTDGTPTGTIKLATFANANADASYRPRFTQFAGAVYFTTGAALWRHAPASTFATQVAAGAGRGLAVINGALYDDRTDGIYRTDPGGTSTRIATADLQSDVVDANGTLFFIARADNVTALYKSDGTPAGTENIAPVQLPSNGTTLVAVGDRVYFEAVDATNGAELWTSTGTAASTGPLADLRAGLNGSLPRRLVAFGGSLYFTAFTDTDGGARAHLWKSDGTAGTTVSVREFPANSRVNALTPIGNRLYLAAQTPEYGDEIWTSDGTTDGTRLSKDVYPGPGGSRPHEFVDVGGVVYFQAVHPGAGYALLKIDGETAAVVHDYVAGPLGASIEGAFLNDGRLVYSDGATTVTGRELYVTDGTPGAATLLKDINPLAWTGSPDSLGFRIVNANGTLYFAADPTAGASSNVPPIGVELWKTDGTPAGTVLVKDINPKESFFDSSYASEPYGFTYFDGLTYFVADDGVTGPELWKTDGTPGGTSLVSDFTPGEIGSYWNDWKIVGGNKLYYTNGTTLAMRTAAGGGGGMSKPFTVNSGRSVQYLADLNGTLLFAGYDGQFGTELWKSDGTFQGTVMLKDIATGSAGNGPNASAPRDFIQLGGNLLFSATDTVRGRELWKTDGTAAGTVLLKDIDTTDTPGIFGGSDPTGFTRLGGAVYFSARDDANGYSLWRTDGTAAGTTIVRSFGPDLSRIRAAGGRLYFFADDGVHGRELWVSDGTPDGTRLYADINPGAESSNALPVFIVENRGALWFTANDGTAPRLFKIEDTTAPDPAAAAAPDVRAPGVVLPFNEAVTLAAGTPGVQLINRATNQPLDPAAFRLAYDAALDRLTVRFTTPLPDGDYRLVLPAGTFTDAAGNPSTATTHDFFVLAADANHDRAVDFNDLTTLAQNYNKANKTFDQGDFNYDGTVDFADLAILAQRYNTTLAPPAPAPAPPERERDDAPLFSTTPIAQPAAPRPRPAVRPARR